MNPPTKSILAAILCLTLSASAPAQEATPHVYKRVVVLSIGVEQYQYISLPPAPGAVNDAKKVGSFLAERYGYESRPLIGPEATRAAVLKSLESTGKDLGPDDALIVFFAGHGQVIDLSSSERAGYLLPYDANLDLKRTGDPDTWEKRAINMREFTRIAEGFQARHVVLLIDSCCSGFMTGRGKGDLEFRPDLRQLLSLPSRTVVAATTESQAATSRRLEGKEQGVFTSALLATLNSKDAKSVTDVFVDVLEQVASHSNNNMTPRMSPFGRAGQGRNGEFVFLPLAIPKAKIAATIKAAKRGDEVDAESGVLVEVIQRQDQRIKQRVTLKDVIEAFEAPDYHYAVDVAAKSRIWEQKRRRYADNAAMGDIRAMEALHYCLAKGLGLEQDDKAGAYRWAKLAYEADDPGGRHVLGRCLYYSIGTKRNQIAGLKLMRGAAEEGFPISLIQAGYDCLDRGEVANARRNFEKAIAQGVDLARVYLAEILLREGPAFKAQEGKPDPEAALKVLLPAALKEIPEAQMMVARIYARLLEKPDKRKAYEWIVRAASNGSASAQVILANELIAGHPSVRKPTLLLDLGLKPDLREAHEWIEQAANQPAAEENFVILRSVANVYHHTNDFEKAGLRLKKLDALSHSEALQLESSWFMNGNQLRPADLGKGYDLAVQAVATGDSEAKMWLGAILADGTVPKEQLADTKQGPTGMHHALHYWTLASEQADGLADQYLRQVATDIVDQPDVGYWELFQRVYPKDVPRFRAHSGGRLLGLKLGLVAIEHEGPGVLITRVVPKGPANRIGLEIGDAILRINGQAVNSLDDFARGLAAAGTPIKLVLRNVRDGLPIARDLIPNP